MSSSCSPIDYLLSRQSVKFVRFPAPSQSELDLIMQAAMSAPDHGRLRPWRFRLIREPAKTNLADMVFAIQEQEGAPVSQDKQHAVRAWLQDVPLLIAVACRLDHANVNIPEEERVLATGAAVMNILNAAYMLGYGAFWSTGLGTHTDGVPLALGFDTLEHRFLGYVVLGTPTDALLPVTRPDYRQFVSEWTGVAS